MANDGFFHNINDTEAGQLLGFAANSVQVGTFLEESSPDWLARAIRTRYLPRSISLHRLWLPISLSWAI